MRRNCPTGRVLFVAGSPRHTRLFNSVTIYVDRNFGMASWECLTAGRGKGNCHVAISATGKRGFTSTPRKSGRGICTSENNG